MAMSDQHLNEKFKSLISDEVSPWIQEAEWRHENRGWLDRSFEFALRVLGILKEKGMSQKELAEKMNVSAQQVSKILKGSENLTLETISKLEQALEVQLVNIVPSAEIRLDARTSFFDYNNTNYFSDSNNLNFEIKISKSLVPDVNELSMDVWDDLISQLSDEREKLAKTGPRESAIIVGQSRLYKAHSAERPTKPNEWQEGEWHEPLKIAV